MAVATARINLRAGYFIGVGIFSLVAFGWLQPGRGKLVKGKEWPDDQPGHPRQSLRIAASTLTTTV
jgi:hypothetical protein